MTTVEAKKISVEDGILRINEYETEEQDVVSFFENLQLRFVLLMTIINSTIEDSESKQRLSEQAVKICHKESGIPMSELVSLIKRMTEEVKEITDYLEKNIEEMREFFSKN